MPHSEIHGSKGIRTSPTLIAAYHVLHRLCMPRHPPNALKTLDHSHCQYPSNIAVQRYQQKDQLLEIQSVMAVKHINHNAGLEQATCDISQRLIRLHLLFTISYRTRRLKSPQTCFFPLLTANIRLNTKNTSIQGIMVEPDGIEPTTPCLQSRCSPS